MRLWQRLINYCHLNITVTLLQKEVFPIKIRNFHYQLYSSPLRDEYKPIYTVLFKN